MRHPHRMQAHPRPDVSPMTDGIRMPRLASDLDYFSQRAEQADDPAERDLWERLASEIEDYLAGDGERQEELF